METHIFLPEQNNEIDKPQALWAQNNEFNASKEATTAVAISWFTTECDNILYVCSFVRHSSRKLSDLWDNSTKKNGKTQTLTLNACFDDNEEKKMGYIREILIVERGMFHESTQRMRASANTKRLPLESFPFYSKAIKFTKETAHKFD